MNDEAKKMINALQDVEAKASESEAAAKEARIWAQRAVAAADAARTLASMEIERIQFENEEGRTTPA